jgi:3-hydroxyisobutyrate dehydrogenase-like beta-hydroxyacid dehydrogenase
LTDWATWPKPIQLSLKTRRLHALEWATVAHSVNRFALIGHGAVGSLFARLLRTGGAQVISYDVLLDDPQRSGQMRSRIAADGARPSLMEEAIRWSEYILVTTPVQACREVAAHAAPHLRPDHVYCDFASASPALKREVAAKVAGSRAAFVEGAILGAVGASLTSPAILLGGEAAEAAAVVLSHYGLRASFYSREIGRASAFKMIRSVFSKGMETLLIETLVSAKRAGLLDEVWREIRDTLAPDRMERMLETWIRSHAVSSNRRYHEMLEVGQYLEELNMPPVVTRAAADVFRRSTELGIAAAFEREPDRFTDVIDFLASKMKSR